MHPNQYGYVVREEPEVFRLNYGYVLPENEREVSFLATAATTGASSAIPGLAALGPVGWAADAALGLKSALDWANAAPSAAQKTQLQNTVSSTDAQVADTWMKYANNPDVFPNASQQIDSQYQTFMRNIQDPNNNRFMSAAQKAAYAAGLTASYNQAKRILQSKTSNSGNPVDTAPSGAPANTPNASGSSVTGVGGAIPALLAGVGLAAAVGSGGGGGGGTGAAKGSVSYAQTVGNDVMAALNNFTASGAPNLDAFNKWLNDLTSTDSTARMTAAGPQIADITSQTEAAKQSIKNLPRGGEQDYLLANADTSKASDISKLLTSEYAMAQKEKGVLGLTSLDTILQGYNEAANIQLQAGNLARGLAAQNAQGTQAVLDSIMMTAMLATGA